MSGALGTHGHDPQSISERLSRAGEASYVGDGVLGAIDGSVTTMAIVAGALGARLPGTTILVLGFASLLADGLSMAVGNYQRARSDRSFARQARRIEEAHIHQWPEGEREEVRQIFERKGFTAPLLEEIVDVITANRDRWVNTMLLEEWGIGLSVQQPIRVAIVTFLAFVLVGSIPLLPFALFAATESTALIGSVAATTIAFGLIGSWRARLYGENLLTGAASTIVTGGSAAVVAFAVAHGLNRLVAG